MIDLIYRIRIPYGIETPAKAGGDIEFDPTNQNNISKESIFLDGNDKICFRPYDEYDHCST